MSTYGVYYNKEHEKCSKKGSEKMSCGALLRKLRGDKSQEYIANELGITKSAWAMYERNERVPRDEVKIRIANYFNKTVQEIFFGHNEHI